VGYHALSADGSTVAFETQSQLLSGDTDDMYDVYVQDVSSSARQLASADAWTDYEGITPVISGTGRYVAFQWNDCIPNPGGGGCTAYEWEIRVWDDSDNTTSQVSKDPNGNQPVGYFGKPAISRDGRYVTFVSDVETLDPSDSNGRIDLFVRDRNNDETDIVSKSGSTQGDEESGFSAVANDGTVAFDSYASNLVTGDAQWTQDVFLIED
jgi:Tol biopolymer transport system component